MNIKINDKRKTTEEKANQELPFFTVIPEGDLYYLYEDSDDDSIKCVDFSCEEVYAYDSLEDYFKQNSDEKPVEVEVNILNNL